MKKGLILALLLAGITAAYAYSYDTTLPLAGNSAADVELQKKTLFTAYSFAHRVASPDCKAFSIVDTNVVSPKENDKWGEVWSIKACSKTAEVPISFTVKDGNTFYAIDPMGVRVTEAE